MARVEQGRGKYAGGAGRGPAAVQRMPPVRSEVRHEVPRYVQYTRRTALALVEAPRSGNHLAVRPNIIPSYFRDTSGPFRARRRSRVRPRSEPSPNNTAPTYVSHTVRQIQAATYAFLNRSQPASSVLRVDCER